MGKEKVKERSEMQEYSDKGKEERMKIRKK
jgi:hypothetical protein